MIEKISFFDHSNLSINLSIWSISTVGLFGVLLYFIKNPEKFEAFIAFLSKTFMYFKKSLERNYVKYDVQSKVNSYVKNISTKVFHLDVTGVIIEWIKPDEIKKEDYIKDGQLIVRLHKSDDQNQNIVNASIAFISQTFLKKAKIYIAKYQREALDLYVTYDFLKNEHREILDVFVQNFMRQKMNNDKIALLFEKYDIINRSGVFYTIFVQELVFLGEKIFAHRRDYNKIYDEVKALVIFLSNYAQRKLQEDISTDFVGEYCKFAIRIIGKQSKVKNEGERIYIKNIESIIPNNETLYLTGSLKNKEFIKSLVEHCKDNIGYSILFEKQYNAEINDKEGNTHILESFLIVLRRNNIKIYHV